MQSGRLQKKSGRLRNTMWAIPDETLPTTIGFRGPNFASRGDSAPAVQIARAPAWGVRQKRGGR